VSVGLTRPPATFAHALRDAEARLRAAGIDDDARLEAEVLLCHALGVSREQLFARLREPIADRRDAFEALLRRRLAREPTAYIVGHKEFYGLDLACTPDALIPRPETELLVDEAIGWLSAEKPGTRNKEQGRLVADVGAGSGAIAVAVRAPKIRVVAVDLSRPALALAHHNAGAHGVAGRVTLLQGDLLSALRGPFDLIAANLPYVPTHLYERLPPEIREHEPEAALHAGRLGTSLIEALLQQAPELLRPGGLLLAEHAWNQGRRLREAARAAFPDAAIETKRDLAGHERLLVVRT